jgi:hypothetical protein
MLDSEDFVKKTPLLLQEKGLGDEVNWMPDELIIDN